MNPYWLLTFLTGIFFMILGSLTSAITGWRARPQMVFFAVGVFLVAFVLIEAGLGVAR